MWEYEYSLETSAGPEALWRHWADMAAWPQWNDGIETIDVDGPFAVGTTFTMTPPGDEPIRMRLVEIEPGTSFTDEMDAGDFVVRTEHRLEPAAGGLTRIVYRTQITGEAAEHIGPELGPQITADFPEVVAALAGRAGADPVPLDPEDSPGFLLWHLTLRWQREIAAALTPLGLTHVQFVLLATAWWLNSRGEDPNQLSVARQAGTDVKMTSEVLRKLEAKGLIVRTVDAADTRARRIRVTERGGELAMAAVTAVEGVDTAFFRAVPDPAALLAMLRTLARDGG
jgi:DNA-binding MarR family transcriptional regulator